MNSKVFAAGIVLVLLLGSASALDTNWPILNDLRNIFGYAPASGAVVASSAATAETDCEYVEDIYYLENKDDMVRAGSLVVKVQAVTENDMGTNMMWLNISYYDGSAKSQMELFDLASLPPFDGNTNLVARVIRLGSAACPKIGLVSQWHGSRLQLKLGVPRSENNIATYQGAGVHLPKVAAEYLSCEQLDFNCNDAVNAVDETALKTGSYGYSLDGYAFQQSSCNNLNYFKGLLQNVLYYNAFPDREVSGARAAIAACAATPTPTPRPTATPVATPSPTSNAVFNNLVVRGTAGINTTAAPKTALGVTGRLSILEGNRFWTLGAGKANGGSYGFPDNALVTQGSFAIRDNWVQKDRIRIAVNGFVGINNTVPKAELDVDGKTRTNELEVSGGMLKVNGVTRTEKLCLRVGNGYKLIQVGSDGTVRAVDDADCGAPRQSCTDTETSGAEASRESLATRGTVTAVSASGVTTTSTDYCTNVNTVIEYYCQSSGIIGARTDYCLVGGSCINGACVGGN